MAGKMVVVTGLQQLDDALAKLEPKIQNKFTKKALRNAGKKVVAEAKAIVRAEAYDTGTLWKSFKVKALKRKKGRTGVGMFVDREKLFEDYAAAHDGNPPNPRKDEKDPHYYLASIEFGYKRKDGSTVQAIKPMRRAIYENESELQKLFVSDVQEMINELDKT